MLDSKSSFLRVRLPPPIPNEKKGTIMKSLYEYNFPEWMVNFPLVDAIHLDFCGCDFIDREIFRRDEHAHSLQNNLRNGWSHGVICISNSQEDWDDAKPTQTFLHEYAHLVAGVRVRGLRIVDHDNKWKRAYRELLRANGYSKMVRNELD